MKAFISRRAQRAAERIDSFWRQHGDDPGLFSREFLLAIEFLESVPSPGSPFPTVKRPGLMRLLLRKSRCHVYFEIDVRKQAIQILHVWDGRRANPPSL